MEKLDVVSKLMASESPMKRGSSFDDSRMNDCCHPFNLQYETPSHELIRGNTMFSFAVPITPQSSGSDLKDQDGNKSPAGKKAKHDDGMSVLTFFVE